MRRRRAGGRLRQGCRRQQRWQPAIARLRLLQAPARKPCGPVHGRRDHKRRSSGAPALASAPARPGHNPAPVQQAAGLGRRLQRLGVLRARGAAWRCAGHHGEQVQVALAVAAVGVVRVGQHLRGRAAHE